MEEKNKKGIVLTIVLCILFCSIGIYVGAKYFNIEKQTNEKTNNTNTQNNSSNTEEKDLKNIKANSNGDYIYHKYAVLVPRDITEEQLGIYNSLITKGQTFGLYFNKSINLDDISQDDMIQFALINYIEDNNIKIGSAGCFMDTDTYKFTGKPYAGEKNCNVKPITKEKLDKYIQERFNTNKVFSSDNKLKSLIISEEPVKYIYDTKSKSYYYGTFPQSGGTDYVKRWLLKVTSDENNIYFYDKVMYCDGEAAWGSLGCMISRDSKDKLFDILEEDFSSNIDEIQLEGEESEANYYINYEYVFDNYNIPIYKHTFTKIDNNYYWRSTELVK